MRLLRLKAQRYRCLRDVDIALDDLNVFIGTNASGKSTVLDALRFLHEGVVGRDFSGPVASRGGLVHLAWKGEIAQQVELRIELEENDRRYEWLVRLTRTKTREEFAIHEELSQLFSSKPPDLLLSADGGRGWWWSGERQRVPLQQSATACALAAASADATFPARHIAEFIPCWGFFDPSPFLLRRNWPDADPQRLDAYGRNLAFRLWALDHVDQTLYPPGGLDRIVSATQSILGLPLKVQTQKSGERVYFYQQEPGLQFPVHQMAASSGTLRVLALMTALFEEVHADTEYEPCLLVGIEEPENHVHPAALAAFAAHLVDAQKRVQIIVTTHSPLLLNAVGDPNAVCVVSRGDAGGTRVVREQNPEGVRRALEESGFGLGEYYETTGFGG